MRFVHTADIHLGARFRLLPAGKRERAKESVRKAFAGVVELCLQDPPADALLVAGDLFDRPDPSRDLVEFAAFQLARLEEKGIRAYVIPGNHDYLSDDSVWTNHAFPDNVHVFSTEGWSAVQWPGKELTIYGYPSTSLRGSEDNPLGGLSIPEEGLGIKVAMIHGSNLAEGLVGPETCNPLRGEDVDALAVHYVALGHYHSFGKVGSKGFYPGSPQALGFEAEGPRYAIIADVDESRVRVGRAELPGVEFKTVELDLGEIHGEAALMDAIRAMAGDRRALKIFLEGCPPDDFIVDPDGITEALAEDFFHLEVDDRSRVPQLEVLPERTVRSHFHRELTEMIEKETDPARRQVLEQALKLGLLALEGRLTS